MDISRPERMRGAARQVVLSTRVLPFLNVALKHPSQSVGLIIYYMRRLIQQHPDTSKKAANCGHESAGGRRVWTALYFYSGLATQVPHGACA